MRKLRTLRFIALFLLANFLYEICFPTVAWALTGGPSQPEVESFEPLSTTQMVDPFTGDFNYNIPLMDVDGYPINISYHSGVTMDQEASWVGLGWNLNPGVINRNMRGLPDDFSGENDQIEKKTYIKDNWTVGAAIGPGWEYFGLSQKISGGISFNIGVNYNNYTGMGIESSVSPMINATRFLKNPYLRNIGVNGALELKSSSKDGLSIQPGVGMSYELSKTFSKAGLRLSPNVSASMSINSQKGIEYLAFKHGVKLSGGRSEFKDNNGTKTLSRYDGIAVGSFMNGSSVSFATQTYTPSMEMQMRSSSFSFSAKVGGEAFGWNPYGKFNGYFSKQGIAQTTQARPAYGYLNADEAKDNDAALMDFNREKDGSYSEESPVLAIPSQTYDLFSASGHGVGGMFRAYRSDIAIVSDPYMVSKSAGGTVDFEWGIGVPPPGFKIGINAQANWSKVSTGPWEKNNHLYNKFGYKGRQIDSEPLYEPASFKNIGEKTAVEQNLVAYKEIGSPQRPQITSDNGEYFTKQNSLVESNGNGTEGTVNLAGVSPVKTKREKKNQLFSFLKVSEKQFCLQEPILFGFPDQAPTAPLSFMGRDNGPRKANHITEVTVTNTQGMRYVYGIAAYNNLQYDFSFTNALDPDDEYKKTPVPNCLTGQVIYDDSKVYYGTSDDNLKNRDYKGNNHFFSATQTPGYAHSYLLTAVLSPDYVDVNSNGPDKNDLGDYTNIGYYRVSDNYNWRVPANYGVANYNEGYKSDKTDDMASFMFGNKELWLVRTIEGKNTIAYFYISKREDALGVDGEAGGIAVKANRSYSYKLDRIALFSKGDLVNPLKQVFFEYDYSLCPLVENNSGSPVKMDGTPAGPTDVNVNAYKGKLTLKRLYFTYGSTSQVKGRFNSYIFDYHDSKPDQTPDPVHNPNYNLKGYDRWGNYKPNQATNCNDLTNPEFPYTDQDKSKEDRDAYASAWSLVGITLPSGGKITIKYEADDYAYVQDKKAMQMYKIAGFGNDLVNDPQPYLFTNKIMQKWIFFELPDDPVLGASFINDALSGENTLYYNCLVNLTDKSDYEYVRGYATVKDATTTIINDKRYGCIQVEPTDGEYHPIAQSAWQLARIHLPYLVTPGSNLRLADNDAKDVAIAAMRGILGYVADLAVLIQGMNNKLMEQDYGRVVDCSKSWVRINNLTGFKYGGGSRVQQIMQSDNWNNMGQSASAKVSIYGQEYTYTCEDNFNGQTRIISSGVASYEPILGGDENPFRKPVSYDKDNKGVPDDHFYTEEPFGESFFPAPQVGYSRVAVRNLSLAEDESSEVNEVSGVTKHATGKVVHEFYTAREFPVNAQRTRLEAQNYSPSYIFSLTKFLDERYVTNSQGFLVELNDMHGKPKAVWNYNEAHVNSYKSGDAFSGVEYKYSVDDKNKLNNTFRVINANNQVSEETVGVDVDMVMDSREMKSDAHSATVAFNYDNISLGIFLIPGITVWGEYSAEVTGFRSAVISKVVNRYGIQTETIVHEEGAQISTRNEMLDAETGEVILTRTQNEFNDSVYNATYPAHWVSDYDGMGPAYQNAGMEIKVQPLSGSSSFAFMAYINGSPVSDMSGYFVPGDEVMVMYGANTLKKWVYFSEASHNWFLIDQTGQPMILSSSNTYTVKVLRSGRRNMQNTPVAQVVSMINPASSSQMNHSVTSAVINASATEFKDKWRTEWNNYSLMDCNDILTSYDKSQLENEFKTMVPVIMNKSGVTRTITKSNSGKTDPIILTKSDFVGCTQLYDMINRYEQCSGNPVSFSCDVTQSLSPYPYLDSYQSFSIDRTIMINLGFAGYSFSLTNYTLRVTAGGYGAPSSPCGPGWVDANNLSSNYDYGCTISAAGSINNLSNLTITLPNTFPALSTDLYTKVMTLDYHTCAVPPASGDIVFTRGSNSTCYTAIPSSANLANTELDELPGTTPYCPSGVSYNTYGSIGASLSAYYTAFNGANSDMNKMAKDLAFFGLAGTTEYYYSTTQVTLPTTMNVSSSFTAPTTSILGIPCLNYIQGQVVNPYVTGIRGNWRKSKDWVYFDNRTPETTVATNIRVDGTYKTFAPFWKWDVGTSTWLNNSSGTRWTMQNEITKYTPSGRALESADALQRHSAAVYDEGNNLMLSMANNAQFNQVASDNMEWYPIGDVGQRAVAQCPIEHFSFWNSNVFTVSSEAHTGTRSMKVAKPLTASTYRDLYQESGSVNNGIYGFEMDIKQDNNGQFNPDPGDYIISAWVKVDNDPVRTTYEADNGAGVNISFVGSSSTAFFKPSGPIVEGWQRIEGTFTVPVGATRINIGMKASQETASSYTLFDDLRIHPAKAMMKGYVYDPKTLRLMAELDENNYATFYEYDKAGKLIRTKRETEKGIATLKESRSGQYKQPSN